METLVTASSLIIGKEVASQTISGTSNSIISRLGHINDNYGIECEKLFEDLDIKFKMEVISNFIKNIKLKTYHISKESVNTCIEYIKNILLEIEKEMVSIQELKQDYEKQWFGNAMSSTKFLESFNKIKKKVTILESRFDYLVKLLNNCFNITI